MGSFETNYDEDSLRSFTHEERSLLEGLHQQIDAKFDEIAASVAEALGYEPSDPRRHEEAEEAIRLWEEGPEMKITPMEPNLPLQQLLRERHDILETILNIHDEAFARDHRPEDD